MSATTISFQVRVEPELHKEIKDQAARHKISANRVLINALDLYFKTEKEREWREAFEAMGRDPDVCDVEYMLPVAREVVFGD